MSAIYALTIVLFIYAAGDMISLLTKAKVPSGVARSIIILAGLWMGIIPEDTFAISTIGGFGMMAVTLMITMLGTTIDTPELKRQVKTIIVCLFSLVISTAVIVILGPIIINPQYAYVGSAVYAGGAAVILMMTSALKPLGLVEVVGFFTILGTAQGFFGQPVCAYFLRKYAKDFLADQKNVDEWADADAPVQTEGKKKIFQLPAKLDRIPVILLKVGLLSSAAAFLAGLTGGKIHAFVLSLILGWIAVETGFLQKGTMGKIESSGIITLLAACVLFSNYVGITPEMFLGYLLPIFVVMILGMIGTFVGGFIMSKVLKMPVGLAVALGLTCTFGFPNTMILTNDVCDAMASNERERKALYNVLMPKMLVAGFVTVTMASMFVGSFVLATFF